jgi:hypothetical protein
MARLVLPIRPEARLLHAQVCPRARRGESHWPNRAGLASYLLYAMRAPEPGGTQLYVTSCPATAASARSALSESGADASPGTNTAEPG